MGKSNQSPSPLGATQTCQIKVVGQSTEGGQILHLSSNWGGDGGSRDQVTTATRSWEYIFE